MIDERRIDKLLDAIKPAGSPWELIEFDHSGITETTPAGEYYFNTLMAYIRHADSLEVPEELGRYRLTMRVPRSTVPRLLGRAFRKFDESKDAACRNCDLVIEHSLTAAIIEAVDAGECAIGIGLRRRKSKRMDVEHLLTTPIGLVYRDGHPLGQAGQTVPLARLKRETVFMLLEESEMKRLINAKIPPPIREFGRRVYMPSEFARVWAMEGMGAALALLYLLPDHDRDLARVTVPDQLGTFKLYLYVNRKAKERKAVAHMADCIRQAAAAIRPV